jgi:hypothetical protein
MDRIDTTMEDRVGKALGAVHEARAAYRLLARIAIAAMCEPTREMIEAGDEAIAGQSGAGIVWNAMLAKAVAP